MHWLRPELVAEIEYEGFTGDGLLRQAAFKGLREDKPAEEVEAETPAPAATALAEPATAVKRTHTVTPRDAAPVMGVMVTHADKPLWPDALDGAPVTKLDLARYYEAVGDWLIRHVQFDRVEALIAAAQVAALELHPWNNEPGQPEQPGRLVFDLDPAPDVPFDQVIAGAREIRERLEALGLVGFCKTTGGKGLHVVTPLQAKGLDWPAAKAFAMGVCKAMAADAPSRYLINMAKKARSGRIFLDYLRNDRMSTAVAPLSPRGRPGAPVSMPLTWAQLKKGLSPQKYTIRTAPALVGKMTAWEDYDEAARPLAEAIARLGKV
jgi:bifunctional non-homologous end joining protein LigD